MMPDLNREKLKTLALIIAGLIAIWCMFIVGWCTMWKIYIEIPVLFVLSNMATGITSCITTILVGRTLAQLNQGADSDTTTTQTVQTQTVTKPKAPPIQPDVVAEKVVEKLSKETLKVEGADKPDANPVKTTEA